MSSQAVTSIDLQSLTLVASGKVRELYQVNECTLLMVVTDRVSAYDKVLFNGVPDKGTILCQISAHWFTVLGARMSDFKEVAVRKAVDSSRHSAARRTAALMVFFLQGNLAGPGIPVRRAMSWVVGPAQVEGQGTDGLQWYEGRVWWDTRVLTGEIRRRQVGLGGGSEGSGRGVRGV